MKILASILLIAGASASLHSEMKFNYRTIGPGSQPLHNGKWLFKTLVPNKKEQHTTPVQIYATKMLKTNETVELNSNMTKHYNQFENIDSFAFRIGKNTYHIFAKHSAAAFSGKPVPKGDVVIREIHPSYVKEEFDMLYQVRLQDRGAFTPDTLTFETVECLDADFDAKITVLHAAANFEASADSSDSATASAGGGDLASSKGQPKGQSSDLEVGSGNDLGGNDLRRRLGHKQSPSSKGSVRPSNSPAMLDLLEEIYGASS